MQLGFLSEKDWDMWGKAVRLDAAAEAPLVEENYDIFVWLKVGSLFVAAAT